MRNNCSRHFLVIMFVFLFAVQTVQAQVRMMPMPEKKEFYYPKPLFIAEPQKFFSPRRDLNDDFNVVTQQTSAKKEVYLKNKGNFLKANYQRVSKEHVLRILKKYGSIPGGITLEGGLRGLSFAGDSVFDPLTNKFILSDGREIDSLLSSIETKEIVSALLQNNLLGVSLGQNDVVYGDLKDSSLSSVFLKMADHFLGAVTFACEPWIIEASLPKGYKPKRSYKRGGIHAVYFNFEGFDVSLEKSQIIPLSAVMNAVLVPLTADSDGGKGLIPDMARIEKEEIPHCFEENIKHIVKNIDYYENDSRIKRVCDYGITAALVRSLKEAGQLTIK